MYNGFMEEYFLYHAPFGDLHITVKDDVLVSITLHGYDDVPICKTPSKTAKKVFDFLDRYFKGERGQIDFDYAIKGSAFQKAVLAKTSMIPYGKTCSYQDIAKAIAKERDKRVSFQAVGQALKHNPLMIVIPCHRVIKSDGNLGGYDGDHMEIKKYLLKLEMETK